MIDSIDDNDNKQQQMSTTASLLINSTFSISKNPDKLEYINQNNGNKYTTHMEASDNIVTIRNNNNNHMPITQVKQLFVGNLPFRVRWQDLKDLFRKSGQVQRADVALTYDGRSKGHGTVLFQTVEDAQTAINMLHNFKWFGRILEVREDRGYIEQHSSISKSTIDQQQQSKNKNTEKHYIQMNRKTDTKNVIIKQDSIQPGRQLFVGNLPYYCQWQELKDLFRGAGNVLRADVAQDSDGKKNLGYGIVLFAVLEDAKRAIAMYDGYKYQGRQLRVRFDKYSPFISYNQQDQYNQQHTQHSKRYTSETNNNMNHNYITDKDALECLQQTYGKFNNEHYSTHSIPDHFYPIQPGLHYPSIEKDINNNNNTINNNNLFDNDVFTDTNSTILSSSLTTQFNYEQQQQQQQQQQQLSGILYQQEQCTNPSHMNHQYINKSPKNPCLISNYMIPNPSTTSTTIAATGLTSPPLYMYHENSPPIESALSFQLSPSSIDSIEKNTPSTSTSHFHHLYSTGPHIPLLTGSYDLNALQSQQGDKMNKNKCGYNNNNNDKEIKSMDQQLFNNDDEIHLMNVINTIGLNDDSAGLNSDFILSSFIGNLVDDEDDEDDEDDDDLCNKGIMKDKFLKSEISTLWDQ